MNIRLYTREELAKAWHCSIGSIQDLHDSGILKGRYIGRGWGYSEDDIKRFFDTTRGEDVRNYTKMMILKEKIDSAKSIQK